jgi:MoxR-like ATPase
MSTDRRLVKAKELLQMAAYTCGRTAVNEYDALLLEHVLWQRPEESEQIRSFVLAWIARRTLAPTQFRVLLDGMQQRAMRDGRTAFETAGLAAEAHSMCEVRVQTAAAVLSLRAASDARMHSLLQMSWMR